MQTMNAESASPDAGGSALGFANGAAGCVPQLGDWFQRIVADPPCCYNRAGLCGCVAFLGTFILTLTARRIALIITPILGWTWALCGVECGSSRVGRA
jgi:hypothetical protein